jgi:secreted trypsin-like serine protease
VKRAELATYFHVAMSRLPVRGSVIDEANSSFCGGNYMDGNWIQNDPHCQEKVTYRTVTLPSDYIMVQVKPVSPGPDQAEVAAR